MAIWLTGAWTGSVRNQRLAHYFVASCYRWKVEKGQYTLDQALLRVEPDLTESDLLETRDMITSLLRRRAFQKTPVEKTDSKHTSDCPPQGRRVIKDSRGL